MSILDWQVAALTVTGVASVAFVLVYGVFAPWYKSQIGRALMFSEVSLGALVGLSLLAYWFHFTISDATALGIFGAIALAALLRLWFVIDKQLIRRNRRT